MTGFGKAITELPDKKITVEIKSLNSKQLDLSVRIPSIYRENEMQIRTLVAKRLERGKVDVSIFVESTGKPNNTQINIPTIQSYYEQIKNSAALLNVSEPTDWFQILLRMPEAIKTEVQELEESELNALMETVEMALEQLQTFRKQEGDMLNNIFIEKINNIASLLKETAVYEHERIDKIKNRINESLSKIENFDYDKNRFEQEMIFYIEKLDINEEKHRLDNHLKYFIETLEQGKGQGKKLGFISQEIGREINTMGSKSNHVELQKLVVRMKDELEQIKEQVLNVL